MANLKQNLSVAFAAKRCAYKNCRSDSQNNRMLHMKNVEFFSFPNARRNYMECKRWVESCGRPEFTVNMVTANSFICNKHFFNGGPCSDSPYPVPYSDNGISCKLKSSTNKRLFKNENELVEPRKKTCNRRKILRSPSPEERLDKPTDVDSFHDETSCHIEEDFRKENYSENMFLQFEKYKSIDRYCDIVLRIVTTNTLFKAHTLILSSASIFFEELLRNPKHRDCKNIVLSLPEYIESSGLGPVLSYIYSGKIHITKSTVVNIFKVAWLFKMDDILQMCREFCQKYGSPQQEVSVASLHVLLQRDKKCHQKVSETPFSKSSSIAKTSKKTINSAITTPLIMKNTDVGLPAPKNPVISSRNASLSSLIVKNTSETTSSNQKTILPSKPRDIRSSNSDSFQQTTVKPMQSTNKNSKPSSDQKLSKPLLTILPKLTALGPATLSEKGKPQSPIPQIMQKAAIILPTSTQKALEVPSVSNASPTLSNSLAIHQTPSITPSREQKISLTKQVFDHINNMCQQNAQNGKSSRVFFIKTGKPIDDIKSLVTTSLDLIRSNPTPINNTSINDESKQQDSITIENKFALPDKPENCDGISENISQSNSKCKYCISKNKDYINEYIVHFFKPRFILDANGKNLKRHGQAFGQVTLPQCIAVVEVKNDIYTHPVLYIVHALKEKIKETNEYSIIWTDIFHKNDSWRFAITISDQFWVLERGEVRFAFPKNFEITDDIMKRYKDMKISRTPIVTATNENQVEIGVDKKNIPHDIAKELKCEYCILDFNSIAIKARHIYGTHRQEMARKGGHLKFICTECKEYKNRSLMGIYFHQYREHGLELSELIKQFHCGLCLKVESSLLAVKNHYERIHKSSRDYMCDKCGFAFKTASVLASHMRYVHVKNFKSRCGICKKYFKDRSRLSVHMRIHTGEKPFKCEDCDYSSAFRGNLKTHRMKKHNEELPCINKSENRIRLHRRVKAVVKTKTR